jgi:hypothetical protein
VKLEELRQLQRDQKGQNKRGYLVLLFRFQTYPLLVVRPWRQVWRCKNKTQNRNQKMDILALSNLLQESEKQFLEVFLSKFNRGRKKDFEKEIAMRKTNNLNKI